MKWSNFFEAVENDRMLTEIDTLPDEIVCFGHRK